MATVNYTTPIRPNIGTGVAYPWALAQGDDGAPVEEFTHADRCVSVSGTFGAATVTIQGSNDGVNWFTLRDPQGTLLTFTSGDLRQVQECPRYMRPVVAGGDGSTALNVMIFGRRSPGGV